MSSIIDQALDMIGDGMVVGLGSGRAASSFIEALGRRVQTGLRVCGVPTSSPSERLARTVGIPLATLAEVQHIDIAVDGADEVDPHANLIKGLGGALVREKVVAAAARNFVILIIDAPQKLVPQLGANGVLPVEVVPFALPLCERRLRTLGFNPRLRRAGADSFVSDNGNFILDCGTGPLADPWATETALRAIPGVVGTGLFLGMADVVLVQEGEKTQQIMRTR